MKAEEPKPVKEAPKEDPKRIEEPKTREETKKEPEVVKKPEDKKEVSPSKTASAPSPVPRSEEAPAPKKVEVAKEENLENLVRGIREKLVWTESEEQTVLNKITLTHQSILQVRQLSSPSASLLC